LIFVTCSASCDERYEPSGPANVCPTTDGLGLGLRSSIGDGEREIGFDDLGS